MLKTEADPLELMRADLAIQLHCKLLRNGDAVRSVGTPRSKQGRRFPRSSLPYREGLTRLDHRVRATLDNSLSKTALYGGQNKMPDAGRP
jgi:hypothetical protein